MVLRIVAIAVRTTRPSLSLVHEPPPVSIASAALLRTHKVTRASASAPSSRSRSGTCTQLVGTPPALGKNARAPWRMHGRPAQSDLPVTQRFFWPVAGTWSSPLPPGMQSSNTEAQTD
ncbi:hypothetical protein ENSA5_18060 [Enhygromyxa salina]|uniref:Uncharacterized protein n=1 Tax=Enhygromyxa salina TaxID=215803 RepID=A0A2S9YDA3_9BACT|nr:hypothetical protein ENSA5_18060 [Enhygromyxa salina]